MKVKQILESNLVTDNTSILIHNETTHNVIMGDWFQDHILDYIDHEVVKFSWSRATETAKAMVYIYVK